MNFDILTVIIFSLIWAGIMLVLQRKKNPVCLVFFTVFNIYIAMVLYSTLRFRFPPTFSRLPAPKYLKDFFIRLSLIPFAASVPVYFAANDYGRWFTGACVNFALMAIPLNLPCREYARRLQAAGGGSGAEESPEFVDKGWVFFSISIINCVLALILWPPRYCLFRCEIVRGPLDFLYIHLRPVNNSRVQEWSMNAA